MIVIGFAHHPCIVQKTGRIGTAQIKKIGESRDLMDRGGTVLPLRKPSISRTAY